MLAQLLLILSFIAIFSLGWGVYFFILYPKGWLYTSKTQWVSTYFGFAYLISYFLFFYDIKKVFIYTVCVVLGIYSFVFIRKLIDLSIREKYLFVKIFEILFQQLLIYVLIIIFSQYSDQYIYFGLLFGCVHIPILFIKYIGRMRFVYFLLSFLGGYLFIYLTRSYTYGYYLSYIIHYLFYVAVGKSIPERILKRF